MISLFLNALSASAGGGLTYVRNVASQLAARHDIRASLLLSPVIQDELGTLPNIRIVSQPEPAGTARRYLFEQRSLPGLIKSTGANVLISAGNFALRNAPVPQILLSRNALYTSGDFYADLQKRGEYRLWLDTRAKGWLARRSVKVANITVAPSQAFADDLQRWTGKRVTAVHHGFDRDSFFRNPADLTPRVWNQLSSTRGSLRLLFVSHYNYYRNFETLIRATARVAQKLGRDKIKLFLTCNLKSEDNPGPYRAESAARLVQELGIQENIVELGSVPYSHLHHVYRTCDIYVTPSYCESFAHPLVEAMSCGLPIVASDLPVHREICQQSAIYFPRFSDRDLGERIMDLASSPERCRELGNIGLKRAGDFSWSRHVDQIVLLASQLIAGPR
jgi:glycosyltransferase involved in cell wall biosynthesis